MYQEGSMDTKCNVYLRTQNFINYINKKKVATFKKNFFYWSRVDLQCCVSFSCTATWFSYTHTYIHSFSDSFPIYVITENWAGYPVQYSRFLLVICLIYSSVCVSWHEELCWALVWAQNAHIGLITEWTHWDWLLELTMPCCSPNFAPGWIQVSPSFVTT